MINVVTKEAFEEWQHHPVTRQLMKRLKQDREEMKEGLVNNSYVNDEEVKGRCRVIATLLEVTYEELMSNYEN